MKKKCVSSARAVLSLAAVLSTPAFAQMAAGAPLKETVVTATRAPTRTDELVSDVVVLRRADIEASSGRTLTELLGRIAGVQLAANGGQGKTSAVFIRGTESRHTILMIDGVRMGSATAGSPAWDNLPVDMIERIEVLKGPASALYGSEGVGGVVQIFTRKGRDGFHPYAALTVGSLKHSLAAAGFTGGQGALTYALGLQRLHEDGFSSTNPKVPFGNFNADVDPFRQNALNASLAWQIKPDWRADAGVVYSDGLAHYDDGPGLDTRSALRNVAMHMGVKGRVLANWHSELRFSQGDDTTNSIIASFPGSFKTEQSEWRWQNTLDTSVGAVQAGLERREQKVSGTTAYTVTQRTINAAFVGLNGTQGDHSWQANLRRDENSQFGGASTGFVGYGYKLSSAWRMHASHGTSFVAPSFNQLYFPGFGNPALQAERGRNTDLGLTWAVSGHEVKLVHFDNKIRGYITNTTIPANIPRSRIEGWSLSYGGKVGALALRAAVDQLDPRNELNGRLLPRRAREQVTLGADWTAGLWQVGGSLLRVGSRFDDVANTAPLSAYTTLDVYAQWQLAPAWALQAKVNNLTNRQYETALGYNQSGRAVYFTLRWQPK